MFLDPKKNELPIINYCVLFSLDSLKPLWVFHVTTVHSNLVPKKEEKYTNRYTIPINRKKLQT